MSGTIVVDRIESDASYASSINIASPLVVANTVTFTNNASFTSNTNFDSGTLFVDAVNNRVGIGTQNPVVGLQVTNPSGGGQIRVVSSDGNILQLISDSTEASIRAVAAVPLTLRTSNEERLRITSDGYFGFGGVTSPQERFHLANRQFSAQTFRTFGAQRGGLGNNPTNAIIFNANVPYIAEPGICETWLLTVTAVANKNLNEAGTRIATFLMHINRAGNNGGGGNTTTNINFTSLGSQLDTKTGGAGVSSDITMSANIPSASTGTHTCNIRVSFSNSSAASDTRCHISGFVLGSTTAQVTTVTYP